MKKLMSIILAAVMLVGVVLPVAAEEGVKVTDGTTKTVDADVTVSTEKATAVEVSGENSKAIINGSAEAGSCGKGACTHDNGTIEISGDAGAAGGTSDLYSYGVYAEGGTVTIGGDTYAGADQAEEYGCGVYAYKDAVVTVNGDVYTGENGKSLWVDNSAQVTVGGDVYFSGEIGTAAEMYDGSCISVGGDMTGTNGVSFISTDGNGCLIVEGTLSGTNYDISVGGANPQLPDIVVGSLGSKDVFVGEGGISAADVFAKIKYIINGTGIRVVSVTTNDNVTKTEADRKYENKLTGATYDVANETDKITLAIDETAGYRLKSLDFGSYAKDIVKNADGTYTLTVLRGGDLNFVAVYEEIPEEPVVPVEYVSLAKYYVGAKIWLNDHEWIITDIDKETGDWSLSCVDTLTEEQLEDLEETLKDYLTEEQLKRVIPDKETEELVKLADEKVADKYFEGDVNHMSIKCYDDIVNVW